MVESIAKNLQKAGFSPIFLVVKKRLPLSLPQLVEECSDWHPLYGVSCALQHCAEDFCLITPCDLPFVSIESYQRLLHQKNECFFGNPEQQQPLLGVFATSRTKEALCYARGHKSVMSFVRNHTVFPIESHEIQNINRPTDRRDSP